MPYRCQFCGSCFNSRSVVDRHVDHLHRSQLDLSHACEICGKKFAWFGDLKKHLNACWRVKRYTRSRERARVKARENTHVKARENTLDSKNTQCEVCGKVMKKAALRIHSFSHATERPFVCQLCGSSFVRKACLDNHFRLLHLEITKKYKCDVCEKRFKSAHELKDHIRHVHAAQKPWSCHFCQKSFSRRLALRHHVLTHTKEQPHRCTMCGRGFTKPDALRVHLRVHTKEKPFSCDDCGKRFSHKVSLAKYHSCPNTKRPQRVESVDVTAAI